jgi:hypothetical protein
MDKRLQKRYLRLVGSHMNVVQAVAAGIQALPDAGEAFAATQAAWRFFHNPRVTLPALVEPLREAGRKGAEKSESAYVLVVFDWSKMDYASHSSKRDQTQISHGDDWGYELATALLVDAASGAPLAPMGLTVTAAHGMHSTQVETPQRVIPHLEQVLPWMNASHNWGLGQTCVHVIDREADSLKHLRKWDAQGHRFLVRGDDRRVTFRDKSRLLSEIIPILKREKAFQETREVTICGKVGQQWVAETEVLLKGCAWGTSARGKNCRVPGQPLRLRLVIVEVRTAQGRVLARWILLTNVWDVSAAQIALWYYWRWKIETFHKLLKSAGLEMEEWQQETAVAITKRLLVACMACVTVWHLERETSPPAEECKKFLVRLSGRQTKRTRPVTTPALLTGLHLLISMLLVLENYTVTQLRQFASEAAPILRLSG